MLMCQFPPKAMNAPLAYMEGATFDVQESNQERLE